MGIFTSLVNASGDGATQNSNGTVINSKSGTQEYPSVASLDDGGFVVTWTSHSTHSSVDGGSHYGVFGQRYDATGAPDGDEFRINTSMDIHMAYPEVTATDEGFAVAWYYWNGDVYGQAFSTTDANGNPVSGTPQKVGDEIVANDEHLSGTQNEQTISRLDDGGFLISWADHDGSGGDRGGSSTDIYARRFDANGEPQQFSLSVDATGAGALNATQVFSGGDALGARVDGEAGDDALYGGDSDDILQGGDGNDFVRGGGGGDTLAGDAGDDILIGGEGSDILAGGADTDIAIFGGSFTDYTVTVEAGALTVTDSAGDADTLYGIETLRFDDGDYAIGDDGTDTTLTHTADSAVTTLSGLVTVTDYQVSAPDAALSASGVAAQQSGAAQAGEAVDAAAVSAQADAVDALAAQGTGSDSGSTTTTTTNTGPTTQTAGYTTETLEEFQVNTSYGMSDQLNPAVTGR